MFMHAETPTGSLKERAETSQLFCVSEKIKTYRHGADQHVRQDEGYISPFNESLPYLRSL